MVKKDILQFLFGLISLMALLAYDSLLQAHSRFWQHFKLDPNNELFSPFSRFLKGPYQINKFLFIALDIETQLIYRSSSITRFEYLTS